MKNPTSEIDFTKVSAKAVEKLKRYKVIADKYISFCQEYQKLLVAKYPAMIYSVTPTINTRFTEDWTLPCADEDDSQIFEKVIDKFHEDQEKWLSENKYEDDEVIMAFIRLGPKSEYYNQFVNDDS